MARERKLKVDTAKFDELMDEQRERARAAQKDASLMLTLTDTELPVTQDLHKYQADQCQSKVVGWIHEEGFDTGGRIESGAQVGLVLDRTCFYAEAGGQVGDCGLIESESGRFVVEGTIRIANCVVHRGRLAEGSFGTGDKVKATVSKDRDSIKKNHTATHLLQWALQRVIGTSVAQQGSLVGPDYLRFDFTCPRAPSDDQLRQVERLVGEKIADDLPVTCAVMPRTDAQKLGAMALFGEKYGNEVRVVAVGADGPDRVGEAFSKEFCGGTHVDRTGFIGDFKVIKEESISAGVRRITALTGSGLADYLKQRSDIIDELSRMLKVPAEALPERVGRLIKDNKELSKKLKSAGKQKGVDSMVEARQLLDQSEKVGGTNIITGRLTTTSVEQARAAIDMLKKKAASAAVVLGFAGEDKATLLAGLTEDLVDKGMNAGELIRAIAPIIDGGGGGRPHLAQAGGKKPDKINDALAEAKELLHAQLAGT
jgi:alanyl-tRNA synthetase